MNFIHRNFLSSEVLQRHDESTNHLQLYLSHFLLVTLATFSACSTLYNWHNKFSLRQTTPIFFVYSSTTYQYTGPVRFEQPCNLTVLALEDPCFIHHLFTATRLLAVIALDWRLYQIRIKHSQLTFNYAEIVTYTNRNLLHVGMLDYKHIFAHLPSAQVAFRALTARALSIS
jgi:hypothetical protein